MNKPLSFLCSLTLLLFTLHINQIQCRSVKSKRETDVNAMKAGLFRAPLAELSAVDRSHFSFYDDMSDEMVSGEMFTLFAQPSTEGPGEPIVAPKATGGGTFMPLVAESLIKTMEEIPEPSTTSAPLDRGAEAPTDEPQSATEERIAKISFASRNQFRVRKNCRCIIHGRCSRISLCD